MNSNWSYSPETVKLGVDLCDLDLWPLTLTFCMDVTFVIGNNSWKFHDDTMMGTWWKRCDRRTDRRTDRQTDRQTDWTSHIAAWSQLKISMNKFHQSNMNPNITKTKQITPKPSIYMHYIYTIWLTSQRCDCLVALFCYHSIAKTGNKTVTPLWPDPYGITVSVWCWPFCYTLCLLWF